MLTDLRYDVAVFVTVCILSALVYAMRYKRPHTLTLNQRNLLATNYGSFTTLYALFLGLAVVTLLQTYNDITAAITDEADLILIEYNISLDVPSGEPFRQALKEYVDHVKGPGWDDMRRGVQNDDDDRLYRRVWKKLRDMKPKDHDEAYMFAFMLDKMVSIDKLRHKRILAIDGNLYPPIWALIFTGVLFTIVGFYFIDSGHNIADVYYIVMVLTLILGSIFLLYELDTPFSGVISISPDRFTDLYRAMSVQSVP